MKTRIKSTTLYTTPFSKAYWVDAFAELKDTKMLVFAALMIALRVAMKSLAIPLAPNLKINLAFFANALGAMTFGPVVAALAAMVSDTLGCILFPNGPYFFPFILTEVAGSVIFALFLYRAKVSVLRLTMSRFCIDVIVNIVMDIPLMTLYYKMVLGKSYTWMMLPKIAKNLSMFPIESIFLVLFMSAMLPIMYKMHLVYYRGAELKLTKKMLAGLLILFVLAVTCTGSYLVYNYNSSNQASWLEKEDKVELNTALTETALAKGEIEEGQVCIISRVSKKLMEDEVQVEFKVYDVADEAEMEKIMAYRSKDAKGDKALTQTMEGNAMLMKDDMGKVLELSIKEPEQK